MPKPHRRLTRVQVVRALTRLGELCAAAQIKAEIAIYGGTVMMIAYDFRAATKDVDAIFHPPGAIEALIGQVAGELNLPENWMNSGVKTFVGLRESKIGFSQLQIPGLVITRPSPRYLLAMKCMAARLPTPFRGGDVEDIKFLVRTLRIGSIKEVDAIVGDYYGDRVLENEKRWLIEKLIAEVRREGKAAK
ncbi:MAG: hypothetical protein HY736_00495 [Verrucomicrobia bacterium]|nr:hypothetical protein [Verrucomicrobiota bacterium]